MHSPSLRIAALLLVITALACAQARAAQSGYKPCTMVSAAEAEALSGQKVTKTAEQDIPYKKDANHDHDGVVSICTQSFSGTQGLSLTVSSTSTTPEGKAQGAAAAKNAEEMLKKKGAKVEARKYGDTTCSTMILQGAMAAFSATNCAAEKGQLFFSLSVTAGTKGLVPMDQVHTLAEKILSRLP
jgi:hypothetical protein